jgi:preprotein translocase subunit SecF
LPFQIVPPGTHIDFLGKRRVAIAISVLAILGSLLAVPVRGFRLGIDFAGGTEVLLRFAPEAKAAEGVLRAIATACGIREATVVRYGESDVPEFLISFREAGAPESGETECPVSVADRERIAAADASLGGAGAGDVARVVDMLQSALRQAVGPVEVERVEFVGPRVGDDLRRNGLLSIGISCLLVLLYIGFRFSPRYAPGAVVALVHDVVITAGVFVIFGMEFDLTVLAALLAILGYSLNDTIIVYDRIRETMRLHTKFDLVEVLNRSVNETLSRTLLTSGTTLAASGALFALGGPVVRPFALAMTVGIVVGTYSSVFVASPLLLFLEQRYSATKGGDRRSAPPGPGTTARGGEARPGGRKAARA